VTPASDDRPPIATIVSVIDGQRETTRSAGTAQVYSRIAPQPQQDSAAAVSWELFATLSRSLDVAARDLALLLKSRHPLIVCETVEEQRFEALVRAVSSELTIPYWSWSAASGLAPAHPSDSEKSVELAFALRLIRRATGEGTWLLKDPSPHLETPATLRLLRETAQEFAGSARTLVMVGPTIPTRPELEDVQVRFEFALPGPPELEELLRRVIRRSSRDVPAPRISLTPEEARGIVADLQGLTMFEAERALSRAIVYDQALTVEDRPRIRETKKVLVEGGGLLEFVPAPEGLEQVGGLENLKKWIGTRKVGFLPDAGDKPLDPPRGILLLGVQGCGKSLAAKAIASTWGLPLLALDAGKLLAPYIGESERNLRDALKRVERMAPCVLWIDEIEKAFVSARTTESDGGVSKRLVATLLTWMQERASRVFLVATANSVEELPPEMMRKGRVDEVFFVDLPDPKARGQIFRLHLARRGEDPARFDLDQLSAASDGFSGAEIEQAVVSALYEARAGRFALDTAAVVTALRSTRPLSVLRADKIDALREWAAGRCVPAA
jgi:ATPase family associated with various cellular activities (AAA)